MTEPREPETVREDAPPAQGNQPDTGNWYPVSSAPAEEPVEDQPSDAAAEGDAVDEPDAPAGNGEAPEVAAEPADEPAHAVFAEHPGESDAPAVDEPPQDAASAPVEEAAAEEPAAEEPGHQEWAPAVEDAPVPAEPGPDPEPEPPTEPAAEVDAEPEPEAASEPSETVEPAESAAEPTPEPVVAEAAPKPVVDEPASEPEFEPVAPEPDPEPAVQPSPVAVEEDTRQLPFRSVAAADTDAEPTEVVPSPAPPVPDEPVSPSGPPAEAIFRVPTPTSASSPEPTRMEPVSEEEQKLAAERAARRDARVAAFAAPAPQPVAAPEPVVIHKRTNDKFWGSLGLFLLRIVIAAIFAIRGVNILTDIPAAQAEFAKTVLADIPPGPQVWAIITGVASLLIALALLLGLLTRLAGLGVALIAGGALALVYWGPWSPFVAGQPGFLGEFQLVLAAVGLLLLFVGGGGWSLDRSFRAGREKNKRERAAAGA